MKLRKVTITGADNRTDIEDLKALTVRYPFVEWGILFGSGTLEVPRPRFPGKEWVRQFLHEIPPAHSCGHLCGKWVRDLVLDDEPTFFEEYQAGRFGRVQLNFHGQFHKAHHCLDETLEDLKRAGVGMILQFDSVNDAPASDFVRRGLASPLFDISGGAGILPDTWPYPFPGFNGYAGGLSPENVVAQIRKIAAAAEEADIWIDVETRVRSTDDTVLDMAKVEAFLAHCEPFISK